MVFPIAGGTQDTGYEISNSLRFNDDDDPYLARTPSSSGSRTKATVSFWVKRGNLAASGNHYILEASSSTSPFNMTRVRFGDDLLIIDNTLNGNAGNGFYFQSTRKYRDPSAWYHIFFSIDVTQANATDGWELYVNGVEQTKALDFWVQNANLEWSQSGVQMNIGRRHDNGTEHLDGYLAEFHYIDGTIKSHSDFGEFNDNGVWIPKKYDGGSYGTNGFYLEFKQTGTSANSSGIGADTSGNDNHFTPNNLAAIDVTTDTCTNNFCTLNPLTKRPTANGTIREGNLEYEASTGDSSIFGTIGIPPGMKVYFEVKLVSNTAQNAIGIHKLYDGGDGDFTKGGSESGTWSFKPRGSSSVAQFINNGSVTNTSVSNYANDTIVGVAIDNANGHIHYHINGTYLNNSDPTDNNPAALVTGHDATIEQYLHFSLDTSGGTNPKNQFNFGNPPYSISTPKSDSEGFGNFEFDVPSGYFALCTKNLAEYG